MNKSKNQNKKPASKDSTKTQKDSKAYNSLTIWQQMELGRAEENEKKDPAIKLLEIVEMLQMLIPSDSELSAIRKGFESSRKIPKRILKFKLIDLKKYRKAGRVEQ